MDAPNATEVSGMNYEPNKTDWKVGDLVIHDADEKSAKMLMRVTEIGFRDKTLMTRYINTAGIALLYRNRKEVLHDPTRFGIDVVGGKETCDMETEEPNAEPESPTPLAAGMHRDGTIHIYVDGEDSGLSVGLELGGTLVVKVDESKRSIRGKRR